MQDDAISRKSILKYIDEWWSDSRDDIEDLIIYITYLPSVTQKSGHWIEIAKYSDGRHEIECSECGSHIFDRGHANSYVVKEKYKYCPRCGAYMVEPQESEDKTE